MHRHVLHNGRVVDAYSRVLSPGQVGLMNGWGVFSTIRVVDGVLFAFERHFRRMEQDAKLMGIPFPADSVEMEEALLELVQANEAFNGTLRVMVVRNRGGLWEGPGLDRDHDLIAFTADPKSWKPAVKLGIVPHGRHAASEFAGTKILSWSHNLTWLERAQSRGLDEVILLNEHGHVSECTSANVFLSQGPTIYTPPLSSGCLPGITREILLSEVRVPGIQIGERTITLPDLEAAEEVFITSTTRGLLPVETIEGLSIRTSGRARQPVQTAFQDYLARYVANAPRRRQPSATHQESE